MVEKNRLEKARSYAAGMAKGQQAYAEGMRLNACPYKSGDPHRKGWRKGWKWCRQQEHGLDWGRKPIRASQAAYGRHELHKDVKNSDKPVTTFMSNLMKIYR